MKFAVYEENRFLMCNVTYQKKKKTSVKSLKQENILESRLEITFRNIEILQYFVSYSRMAESKFAFE